LIVDSSALLAILFEEAHAEWVERQLASAHSQLMMSTVNLTEVLIRLRDRNPGGADAIEDRLLASGIRFVAPDVEQARLVARARIQYPLNLGDCFAYALARIHGLPLLTTDSDFRNVDIQVVLPD
jgi:ribonuclease VapC